MPIDLMRNSDRFRIIGFFVFYSLPAIIHFELIRFGFNSSEITEDLGIWRFTPIIASAIYVFMIGKPISDGARLFSGFLGLVLYAYGIMLLGYYGVWFFIKENSILSDSVSVLSFFISFPYMRFMQNLTETALNMDKRIAEISSEFDEASSAK